MKLIHISDLHLGKKFRERSLSEDQKYVLDQIVEIVRREKPHGVIVAGDVYDKPVPPAEAVLLFDEFIVTLAGECDHIFIISGNHDSAERLSFGNRILDKSGVHVASRFGGVMDKVILEDEHGIVNVWMLPFIKPMHVKPYHEEIERDEYTEAVARVIEDSGVDFSERNVLIGHQYVTGAERSESEDVPIGGLDGVEARVFEYFDYVALGHLHRAQKAGSERIRYSGSPLKYSFSEEKDEKGVLLLSLGPVREESREQCSLAVELLPLLPLHEVRTKKGSFDQLMTSAHSETSTEREAFLRAELTDSEYIPDGIQRLRTVYPNILEVRYDEVTDGAAGLPEVTAQDEKTPIEYLEDFFLTMRGRQMSREQEDFAKEAIERIWED